MSNFGNPKYRDLAYNGLVPISITQDLIAPCGMNCALCKAHLRQRHPCKGCRDASLNKPPTRVTCKLRLCPERRGSLCDCAALPCDRLKHLDHRYRTRYGMSEIENLEFIRRKGMRKFLESERAKWTSGEGILCVHDKNRYK